jgi:spore coat polysaccharide biosynthesis protein SpsF
MSTKQRIVAIIQARMGSSRLPGKILRDIAGEPMLMRVVERAQRASNLDQTVVATTTDANDKAVVELLEKRDVPFIRGHPTDVLDRYLTAAQVFSADIIVRLTADCPLHDPDVIDKTVNAFLAKLPDVDYASNRLVRTYPIGLDVEVFTRQALLRAGDEATENYQREHVTPYLYEVEGRARLLSVESNKDYGHYRWTVDTPDDLEFVRQVYAHFPDQSDFGWDAVLDLLEQKPELIDINAHVQQRGFRDAEGESR